MCRTRGYSRARGGDQWRIAPPSNAKSTRIVAVFIARSSLQWLTSPPIRCPGDDMTMRGRFWMAWLAAATIAMGAAPAAAQVRTIDPNEIGRASGRDRVCQDV